MKTGTIALSILVFGVGCQEGQRVDRGEGQAALGFAQERPQERPAVPGEEEEAPIRLPPQEAEEARRIIVNWMECEECTDGELAAVVRLASTAVPTLSAILREGPSPARLESVRRSLVSSYQKLREYGETHPNARPRMPEQEYVDTYLANLTARYRARAATALGDIGGPAAERALRDALDARHRPDVDRAVREALTAKR